MNTRQKTIIALKEILKKEKQLYKIYLRSFNYNEEGYLWVSLKTEEYSQVKKVMEALNKNGLYPLYSSILNQIGFNFYNLQEKIGQ